MPIGAGFSVAFNVLIIWHLHFGGCVGIGGQRGRSKELNRSIRSTDSALFHGRAEFFWDTLIPESKAYTSAGSSRCRLTEPVAAAESALSSLGVNFTETSFETPGSCIVTP
jgi:hypothetical protein